MKSFLSSCATYLLVIFVTAGGLSPALFAADTEDGGHAGAAHGEHDGDHKKVEQSDGGHGGHGEAEDLTHGNAGKKLNAPEEIKYDLAIYTFVVFVLLLAILWKFAWGPISDGLERREKAIADNIATAESAADEARRLTQDYEARLDGAADEVKQIIEDAKRDADYSAQQIVAKAQSRASEEGNRMLREVETAKESALKEISDRAADLAIDLAGRIVGRELSVSDHSRLIEEAQSEFASAKSGEA